MLGAVLGLENGGLNALHLSLLLGAHPISFAVSTPPPIHPALPLGQDGDSWLLHELPTGWEEKQKAQLSPEEFSVSSSDLHLAYLQGEA